jgi:hypothetical protein
MVLVLAEMSGARQRESPCNNVTFKDLRLRLQEELKRVEHARIARIRHYLTVSCFPPPGVAPWMYIWHFGLDQNLLNVTSLCR